MKTFVEKKQGKGNKQANCNTKPTKSTANTLVDNRSDSSAQRKLIETIDASPKQIMQGQRINNIIDNAVQKQSMKEDELQMKGEPDVAQRMGEEEEELLQGRFTTAQRQGDLEEEDLMQGKFEADQRQGPDEEELLQGKFETAQRQESLEEEELLQGKFGVPPIQREQVTKDNKTGLPDNLKAGIENLSGYSMDDVSVHYNSQKPAQIQAHAYAQGNDIHLASGQEKHLPHEAWHVVQQRQGRVRPTMQMAGVQVNDDEGLEKEADVMGGRASVVQQKNKNGQDLRTVHKNTKTTQLRSDKRIESSAQKHYTDGWGAKYGIQDDHTLKSKVPTSVSGDGTIDLKIWEYKRWNYRGDTYAKGKRCTIEYKDGEEGWGKNKSKYTSIYHCGPTGSPITRKL
jgi:hypothetical protein